MSMKWVRIADNFSAITKGAAAGAVFMFAVGYSAEGFHYRPEMQQVPTFVKPQWSGELPSHISATATTDNTAAVYVVLPPPR
jgi:hypothetical protein